MATFKFTTMEKSITLSDVYAIDLLHHMGLMQKTKYSTVFEQEDYNNAKKYLSMFLKSLGYKEINWSE